MSSFMLRAAALILMIVDHIGAVFFPQVILLRVIGRLSMPIFCFLCAEGCAHTRNGKKYAGRLLVFALLSELPFDLLFYGSPSMAGQNVLITLFLGVAGTLLYKELTGRRTEKGAAGKALFPLLGVLSVAFSAVLAEWLGSDYGAAGVLFIFALYIGRKNQRTRATAFIVGALLLSVGVGADGMAYLNPVQLFGLAALPVALLYNGREGPRFLRIFFYAAYPLHLLLLFVVRSFLAAVS